MLPESFIKEASCYSSDIRQYVFYYQYLSFPKLFNSIVHLLPGTFVQVIPRPWSIYSHKCTSLYLFAELRLSMIFSSVSRCYSKSIFYISTAFRPYTSNNSVLAISFLSYFITHLTLLLKGNLSIFDGLIVPPLETIFLSVEGQSEMKESSFAYPRKTKINQSRSTWEPLLLRSTFQCVLLPTHFFVIRIFSNSRVV